MDKALRVVGVVAIAITLEESAPIAAAPIQVYGVWRCGSDRIHRGRAVASVDLAILAVEFDHIADPGRLLGVYM